MWLEIKKSPGISFFQTDGRTATVKRNNNHIIQLVTPTDRISAFVNSLIDRRVPRPLPPLTFTPHSLKEHSDMSNDRSANGQQQRKRVEDTLKGFVSACIIN